MADEQSFIAFDSPSSSKKKILPQDRPNTTVFISSLPYTATTTDLLTHFSFIGPVRHGFVATHQDTGKSKGVGYVTYAEKGDAEKAVAELDGGAFGDGRKIRVQWADKKPAAKERVEKRAAKAAAAPEKSERPTASTAPATAAAEAEASTSADPNAIRTLVLSGLPKGITKAVLWKKVRKVHDGIELVYPVEGEEDTANLVFPTHMQAVQGAPKLQGHVYKGSLLSCVLKKRLEKLTKADGKAQSHAGRLIVRNLAWNTTEQDLRTAFLPYGPIHSIDLPTLPSKLVADPSKPAPPPRARGFAFVWFLTRKDAEKAIEGVNGTVIHKSDGTTKGEGRAVAVDWALSKEKWEEAQGKGKEDEAGAAAKGKNDEDESGSSSGSDSEGSDDAESGEESGDSDKEEDADEGGEDVVMSEEPVKPSLPPVDVGSTLFIRNLAFEVTEQELNTLFRSFGPLRYARITMDKSTGRSRGTGFACFWKKEHADEAIAEAEKVARETGTGANSIQAGAKNPFALPTILTADPSSSLVSKLVLHGRTLEVSRAVTREEAGQMKEDGERARHAGDKRNTYLMREGVIFPNSPAAQSLPPAELEKRQESFNARKALLRSNPSLYISKTRLSIRQLPLFATDRTLKRLAIHAVREFNSEVEASTREALSRTEEGDHTLSPALAAREEKQKAKMAAAAKDGTPKGKGKKERDTPVIQSKIIRQTEKLDPITGLGKSKGYGFLEMRSHTDALRVLRWANNNRDVGKLMWEWYLVEVGEMVERVKKAIAARGKESKQGQSEENVAQSKVEDKPANGNGTDNGNGKEKEKESVEELESKLRRLETRMKDDAGGGMRGGKTLLVEFSVENVQVVRRRVDKMGSSSGGADGAHGRDGKRKRDGDGAGAGAGARDGNGKRGPKDDGRDGDRGGGKGRDKASGRGTHLSAGTVDNPASTQPEREKKGLEKLGSALGSLIGRKRRARKG